MTDWRLRTIQRGDAGSEDEVLEILERPVRVVLPDGVPTWRHQLLALTLVDLLGRLFPRIELVVDADAPADALLPPGAALLLDRLEQARAHGCCPQSPEGDPLATIRVGLGDGADVYVDGAGWQSYVGASPSQLPDRGAMVPVGPLIAACRGASQIFQLALRHRLARAAFIIESSYSSALTLEAGSGPIDEPDLPPPVEVVAVLVGAGSVGGATAYLFAHMPEFSGELDVVDDDCLRGHNPGRAILATKQLAAEEAAKVEVVESALAHQAGLDVRPHQKRFEDFVAERARDAQLPLVLSAVDSVASRREIQDAMPLDVIDAACGTEQVSCSVHLTDSGPCIYCLHVGAVLDSTRIKYRLISAATGMSEAAVAPLHVAQIPLTLQHVRSIEAYRRELGESLSVGAFDDYIGKTLETLYREKLLYGEALIATAGGGQAAVAAPFVTALTGFILASEALKAGSADAYGPYRLGSPGALGIMYREDPWRTPADRLITRPARWPTQECLCQSPLRLRLLRERYAL